MRPAAGSRPRFRISSGKGRLGLLTIGPVEPATPLAVGLQGNAQTLVYLINPAINWPADASLATLPPMTNAKLTLKNWPAGTYKAAWFNTVTGLNGRTTTATIVNGNLVFTVPSFTEDLAVSITKQ